MAKKKPAARAKRAGIIKATAEAIAEATAHPGTPVPLPGSGESSATVTVEPSSNGHPILARQTRDLSVPLSSDDLQRVGRELGEVFGAKINELAQQAKLKADMKSRLAKIEADFVQLATTLKTGSETREVEVEVRADYEAVVARAYRLDTGELLDSRPLNTLELQLTLTPEVAAVAEGAMAESAEA